MSWLPINHYKTMIVTKIKLLKIAFVFRVFV